MNATASQTPIEAGTSRRKAHGGGRPSSLVRGPSKGTAVFQELLHARAVDSSGKKSAVAVGGKAAAALAALLAAEASGRKAALPAGGHGAVLDEAAAAILKARAETFRKASRLNLAAALAAAAALIIPNSPGHPKAMKEAKHASAEPAKAPVSGVPTSRHTEPLIRVIDLRHERHTPHPAQTAAVHKTDAQTSVDRDASVQVVLRPPHGRETILETSPRAAPTPASHVPTPTERLREMGGAELVRASHLVLKDGGGEIRLLLKPDSLGSVRVRMNVVDNAIEGRIIVDSAAVKHVFDGSVDALRRALTAEGFQMGSLQVSVGGQEAQADTGGRHQEQVPVGVRRVTAAGFERNVPGAEDMSLGDLFVNLFV